MTDGWLEANRLQWDDRTRIHVASRFYDVDGWLRSRPGPGCGRWTPSGT